MIMEQASMEKVRILSATCRFLRKLGTQFIYGVCLHKNYEGVDALTYQLSIGNFISRQDPTGRQSKPTQTTITKSTFAKQRYPPENDS